MYSCRQAHPHTNNRLHRPEDSCLAREHSVINTYITRTLTGTEAAALEARLSTGLPPPPLPSQPSADSVSTLTLNPRVSSTAPLPAIAEYIESGSTASIPAASPFADMPHLHPAASSADSLLYVPLRPFADRALHLLRQEASALQAYRALLELDLRHLLVVDQGGGYPVGIVTRKDLHNALHAHDGDGCTHDKAR